MKQHYKLLFALVLGLILGNLLHPYAANETLKFINTNVLQVVGQIFLRMIFMIVVPMIFAALVLGVYELGQAHRLGKIVFRTIFYTIIASSASVAIGILLVNTFKPGVGLNIDAGVISEQAASIKTIQKNASDTGSFSQIIIDLLPKNPVDAAARAFDGQMIALMFFALIFGLALSFLKAPKENTFINLMEQVFQACLKIVEWAMQIAPYAVFALVFNTAFKFGHEIFASLMFYVVLVVVGLLLQQFVVYASLLKFVSKRSPLEFFKNCREVYLYAFSTASSNATLPLALSTAEDKLKIPPHISKFVLTVGSTANQNGTALFEGITVLFLAQVYNIDLSIAQQVLVVLMSILAGIGTAGVPGGSLPLIMILIQQLGIPAEGLGIILGVDRFLDMCRTTLNVSGDLVIAQLVSSGMKGKTTKI